MMEESTSIPKVSSSEFQQNVGRYQDMAQRTPVAITMNGRAHTIMMSAALFEVITKGRIAKDRGRRRRNARRNLARQGRAGTRPPRQAA